MYSKNVIKKLAEFFLFFLLCLILFYIVISIFARDTGIKSKKNAIKINEKKIEEVLRPDMYQWKQDVKTNCDLSDPVLLSNILIVASCEQIYAYNKLNGQEVWSLKAPKDSKFALQIWYLKDDAAPDNIYVVSFGYDSKTNKPISDVQSLQINTGKENWRASVPGMWFGRDLLVTRNVVLLRINDTLTALNVKTGEKMWDTRIAESDYADFTYGDGKFYETGNNEPTSAIDEMTGKQVWFSKHGARNGGSPSVAPLYYKDSSGVGRLYVHGPTSGLASDHLYWLNPNNGGLVMMATNLSNPWFNPFIVNNYVIVGLSFSKYSDYYSSFPYDGNQLCALDLDVKFIWWCLPMTASYISDHYIFDNILYMANWDTESSCSDDYCSHIGTKERYVYAIDTTTHKIKWSYRSEDLGGNFYVDDKYVYFSDEDKIYVLDRISGVEKIVLPVSERFVVENKKIYITTPGGHIYLLKVNL